MENPGNQSGESVGPVEDPPPPATTQDQSTSESSSQQPPERRPPPPLSPLTGCYLLIVVGEPHSERHKEIILQKIAKAFLSWDVSECHVSLEKELQVITGQSPEGEEARFGERLIQYATENLVTEILIHPQLNTLHQCMKNLLSSFTKHRHIIHAGYTFAGNGSWILQDGTLSISDLVEALHETEVLRVLKAYENSVSVDIHCGAEGDWTTERFQKEPVSKLCNIRINPGDVMTAGNAAISAFIDYLSPFLEPANIQQLLQPTDVVGNIRFTHPTLYVFPGGQGDAALFGINGFNMLIDGGFARKACFWDFARHLDRLDAVLLTRLNNSTVNGISAVLQRKKMNHVYPQIGHFFCNLQDRKIALSPDGDKDKDSLIVNLAEEGQEIVANLRHLALKPHPCYRDGNQVDPVNLYHKVGHGKLDMYVISPARDSQAVKDFLAKWSSNDSHLFSNTGRKTAGKPFEFPLQNLVSICALLVWQPANPSDTITRILFPGSTPQHKIFEGLEKLRHLEFLKHPVCSAKSISPSASTVMVGRSVSKTRQAKPADNKLKETKTISKPQPKTVKAKTPPKEVKQKLDTNKLAELENGVEEPLKKLDNRILSKDEQIENIKKEIQTIEQAESEEQKKKIIHRSKYDMRNVKSKVDSRAPSKSIDRKKPPEKKAEGDTSPPSTPKKGLTNGTATKAEKAKVGIKPSKTTSPSSTPAKSAKEANNRKVVEARVTSRSSSRSMTRKKEETPPPSAPPAKVERKPISRRPKAPPSPIKTSVGKSAKTDLETLPKKVKKKPEVDTGVVKAVSQKIIGGLAKGAETEKTELRGEGVKIEIKKLEAETTENKETDEKAVKNQLESAQSKEDEEEEEEEEYLIVTKEESTEESANEKENEEEAQTEGEGEMKKLLREEEESEKKKKEDEIQAEPQEEEQEKVEETEEKAEEEEEVEEEEKEEAEGEKEEVEDEKEELEEEKEEVEEEKEEVEEEKEEVEAEKEEEEVGREEEEEEEKMVEEEKRPGSPDQKTQEGRESETHRIMAVDEGIDLKEPLSKEHKEGESLPEEKISNTVETSATTAPTLPEDERIEEPIRAEEEVEQPDEILEVVEEKYIQEETKEEKQQEEEPELPQTQIPTTIDIDGSPVPVPKKHPRDVVKTPDEVADLPMHEEVDPRMYSSGEFSKDLQKKPDEGRTPEGKKPDFKAMIKGEANFLDEEEPDFKKNAEGGEPVRDEITSKYLNIIDELEKSATESKKDEKEIPIKVEKDSVPQPSEDTYERRDSKTDDARMPVEEEDRQESPKEVQPAGEPSGKSTPADLAREFTPADLAMHPSGKSTPADPGKEPSGKSTPVDRAKELSGKSTPEVELSGKSTPADLVESGKISPVDHERKPSIPTALTRESSGKATPADIARDTSGKTTPTDVGKVPSGKTTPVDLARELTGEATPAELTQELAGKSTPADLTKERSGKTTPEREPSGKTTPTDLQKEPSGKSTPADLAKEPSGISTPADLAREPSGKSTPVDLGRETSGKATPADLAPELSGKSTPDDIARESSGKTTPADLSRKSSIPGDLEKETSGKSTPVDAVKEESGKATPSDLKIEPSGKSTPADLTKEPSGKSTPADLEEIITPHTVAKVLSGKYSPSGIESVKISSEEVVEETTSEPSPQEITSNMPEKLEKEEKIPEDVEKVRSRGPNPQDLVEDVSTPLDIKKDISGKTTPVEEIPEKLIGTTEVSETLKDKISGESTPQDLEKDVSGKSTPLDLVSGKSTPHDLKKEISGKSTPVEAPGRTSSEEGQKILSGKSTPFEVGQEDLEKEKPVSGKSSPPESGKEISRKSSQKDVGEQPEVEKISSGKSSPQEPEKDTTGKSTPQNLQKKSSGIPSPEEMEKETSLKTTPPDVEISGKSTPADADKLPSGKSTPLDLEKEIRRPSTPHEVKSGKSTPLDLSRMPSTQGEVKKESPVDHQEEVPEKPHDLKEEISGKSTPQGEEKDISGKSTPLELGKEISRLSMSQETEKESSGKSSPIDKDEDISGRSVLPDSEKDASRKSSPADIGVDEFEKSVPLETEKYTSGKSTPIHPEKEFSALSTPKDKGKEMSGKSTPVEAEKDVVRPQDQSTDISDIQIVGVEKHDPDHLDKTISGKSSSEKDKMSPPGGVSPEKESSRRGSKDVSGKTTPEVGKKELPEKITDEKGLSKPDSAPEETKPSLGKDELLEKDGKKMVGVVESSVSDSVSSGPGDKDISGKSTPFSTDKEISGKISPSVGGKPASDSFSLALAEKGTSGTCSLEKETSEKISSPSPVDISPLSLDEIKELKDDAVKEKDLTKSPHLERVRRERIGSSGASTPDRSHREKSESSLANGMESEEELEKGTLESERQEKESQILDVSSGEEEELKALGEEEDVDSEPEVRKNDLEGGSIALAAEIGKGEKDDINKLVKIRVDAKLEEEQDADKKSGVKRMLVTASSEDGGTETEICLQGGIKVVKEEKLEEEEFSNLILQARKEYNNQRSRKTSCNSPEAVEEADEAESVVGDEGEKEEEELSTLLMQARQELEFVRSKSREMQDGMSERTYQTSKTTTRSETTRMDDNYLITITTILTEEREEQEDGSIKVTTTKETTTTGGKDEGTVVTVNTNFERKPEEKEKGKEKEKEKEEESSSQGHAGESRKGDSREEAEGRTSQEEALETSRRTSASSIISQEDLVSRKDSAKIEDFRQSSTEMSPLKTTYITTHGDSEALMTSSFYGNLPTEDEMIGREFRKGRGYESFTEIGANGERTERTYFYGGDEETAKAAKEAREKHRFVKTYYTEDVHQRDGDQSRFVHRYYVPEIPEEEAAAVERTRFVQRFYTEETSHPESEAKYRFVETVTEEPSGHVDFAKAIDEHVSARGEYLGKEFQQDVAKFTNGKSKEEEAGTSSTKDEEKKKDVIEDWGKPLGLPLPPKGVNRTYAFPSQNISTTSSLSTPTDNSDSVTNWGQPMSLPSPAPPTTQNGTVENLPGKPAAKETPKKEKRVQPKKNISGDNKSSGNNTPNRRSESPVKQVERRTPSTGRTSKPASTSHVYLDLTYVPHHGNSYYSNVEFFKKVRARYYVFSGTEPSKEVYNALLEAKQTWDDKKLEVTIIPTYDTDVLGYWVAENEEVLAKHKIDLSPSASRCTINLQDHETSCSAYRLEF